MDPQRARTRLNEERARLERIRDALLADPETGPEARSATQLERDAEDLDDLGTDTFDHSRDATILEEVTEQLGEIDAAFQRLEEGTYGRSVLSGEPIGDDRLEALPAARYTVEEQARVDRMNGLGHPSRGPRPAPR
jgi:DnaK suppressor protein